jgi:hypothetical protein
MNWIKRQFQKDIWSPYAAGVMLGLVAIASVWGVGVLLSGSGGFVNLAGMIGKALAPALFDNVFFNFIMPPGFTFSVLMLIGLFIGGFLGAASSKTLLWGKKAALLSDQQWKRIIGPQVWKRWLIAFSGAILLEYAAGIAGGCTSGLAISGGMLLAPAAFLFIFGMFISGIITALLVYRGRY